MKYIDLRERTRDNLLEIIRKKDIEIIRLNNIIKEAKEYIEHNYFVVGRIEKIYKILDKVGSEKE